MAEAEPPQRLEVWGGVEATVRRIGDEYFDQLERSGHANRTGDLDLIARLGIARVRYPVLWERVAPDDLGNPDWRWSDERLARLRELGVTPIIGLLHHGSGPRYTDLLDPDFPEKLATYARLVAERYPWADMYTPVNEPLTTARFSCLYGLWYPHVKGDYAVFLRALLNQCRGTVLAMREIRKVNPDAALLQTEDLGKVYSTPLLGYQAELENERRWLTQDLLTGRLTRDHPMWSFLVGRGGDAAEMAWFVENPLPPDILGINTYVTSERFIVEEYEPYPRQFHGGNERHDYSDIEAVRVSSTGMAGHPGLLREAWDRYHLPLAVTEAQLASTREEQLRWIHEAWRAAQRLRADGADVRALTAWALFGSYEWNSLLTQMQGHYENGAFDLRAPQPRWTAVATMVRELATRADYAHPVLQVPGWWRRPERILYKAVQPAQDGVPPAALVNSLIGAVRQPTPILISGATGTLGRAFARVCDARALPCRVTTRAEMDIADPRSVRQALDRVKPWAVINASGYVRVDDAEANAERCRRDNAEAPAVLARACAERGIQLLTFSSDLVFGGEKRMPYVESDPTRPLNVYGAAKAESEQRVLETLPNALVIRASAFFGPWDQHNFAVQVLNHLGRGERFRTTRAQVVSPTYVPDLVNAGLDLLIDAESGVWHLANEGSLSWLEFALEVARRAGCDERLVEDVVPRELGWVAERPAYSVLASERGWLMPSLQSALDRFFAEVRVESESASRRRLPERSRPHRKSPF